LIARRCIKIISLFARSRLKRLLQFTVRKYQNFDFKLPQV